MDLFGGYAQAAAQMFDSALDFHSAEEANDMMANQAQHQRSHQIDTMREQFEFSKNMRASAYQTAMADMKAAGLNPMLASKLGGADVPSAGSGSAGSAVWQPARETTHIVGNALGAAKVIAEIKNIGADTVVREAEAKRIAEDTLLKNTTGINVAKHTEKMRQEMHKIEVEIDNLHEQRSKIKNEAERIKFEVERILPLEEQLRRIEIQGGTYGLAGKRVESEFFKSTAGEVSPYLKQLFNTGSSASGIVRDFRRPR